MQPTDLHLFRSYGRPALIPGGGAIAALATPDCGADRYQSVLHLLRVGMDPLPLTRGPRDSAPVVSPNGELIVFLRAGASGPAQLYAMVRAGGEPFQLAEHPLGASAVTFSPDGLRIAYLAPVAEAGRYGTPDGDGPQQPTSAAAIGDAVGDAPTDADKGPAPEAEAPRRITSLSYRLDGKGFTRDKAEQIFVLDLAGPGEAPLPDSVPRQVTDEPGPIGRPAFTPDGSAVVYERPVAVDSLASEIALISADGDQPGVGSAVVTADGDASSPIVDGGTVYYVGAKYSGNDFAGRTPGLWAAPMAGGAARRLTDAATVHVDASVGDPVIIDNTVLVAVQDRGAVSLRAVPTASAGAALSDLPEVIAGRRVVKSFVSAGRTVAAVVAGPDSCGDVFVGEFSALTAASRAGGADTDGADTDGADTDGAHTDGAAAGGAEIRLSDVSKQLRAAGLAQIVEISGASTDSYPVHGWLVLPPDSFHGPHPVLLTVHGGPHAQYGWGVFDEAQMYASAGYAVVMGNPRGSSGYGEAHGRAVVGAVGTMDADDVLALLDTVLQRDDLDDSRVGLMGGSYGGFMTSWLASQAPGRFVAGISERAVNAWDSFTGASDIGYFFADAYVGSDPAVQRDRSPLEHADGIDIPLLIIHSEHDWRCPIEQAQRLYVSLKRRGATAEMLIFPGEGHELSRSGRPKHRVARFEAILAWWDRYLPVR